MKLWPLAGGRYDDPVGGPSSNADAETRVRRAIGRTQRRCRLARALTGAALTSGLGLLALGAWRMTGSSGGSASALLAGAVFLAAIGGWFLRGPDELAVARVLDAQTGVQGDAVLCAVGLSAAAANRSGNADFRNLAFAHADRALGQVDLPRTSVFVGRTPLQIAACLGMVAAALMLVAPPQSQHEGGITNARSQPAQSAPPSLRVQGREGARPDEDALLREAIRALAVARASEEVTAAVAAALAGVPETRAVAAALHAHDPQGVEVAVGALRAKLRAEGGRQVEATRVGAAFGAAAEAVARQLSAPAQGGTAEGSSAAPDMPASEEEDLSLQRLSRTLQNAADACQQDPEACATGLDHVTTPLEKLARDEARAQAERLMDEAQPGPERPSASRDERRPTLEAEVPGEARAHARGPAPPSPRAAAPEGENVPGDGAYAPSEDTVVNPQPGTSHGTQEGVREGEPPVVPPTSTARDVIVDLPESPADRAQLVRATATGSFATPAYRATYAAYRTAAENNLHEVALPAYRRDIVRRYFHRIRPVPGRASTNLPRE